MTVTHRKMKPGETIFGGGSGILIPFAPASSDNSKAPSSQKQMSELEIQAELKKLRDEGEIPEVIEFMESMMRGLEGKPQGNG